MNGKKLKEIIYENRKKKQLTQEQLASSLNVSDKTVSKWERGQSYPDLLLIPTLAQVLGISINELFDSEDLKPEKIEQFNNKAILEYKKRAIFSICLLLFSPIIFLCTWLLELDYVVNVFSIVLGVIMVIASLINMVMSLIDMFDILQRKYRYNDYARILKSYFLIYSLLLYIPCCLLLTIIDNIVVSIFMETLAYLVFVFVLLWLIYSLKIKIKSVLNVVTFICSIMIFIVGLSLMIIFGTLPYILFFLISQIINFIILFANNGYEN